MVVVGGVVVDGGLVVVGGVVVVGVVVVVVEVEPPPGQRMPLCFAAPLWRLFLARTLLHDPPLPAAAAVGLLALAEPMLAAAHAIRAQAANMPKAESLRERLVCFPADPLIPR